MLCRLVVTSAVWTHWRLLSSDSVKVAGQKRTVARPQLGKSDALASGPATSPVCLRVGVSSEGAMSGRVRVAFVAGLKLLLPCAPVPLLLQDRQELMSEERWSPAWLPDLPVCCQECQYEMESTECGGWKFY